MESNTDLRDKVKLETLKVEFFTNSEELFLYAGALYYRSKGLERRYKERGE